MRKAQGILLLSALKIRRKNMKRTLLLLLVATMTLCGCSKEEPKAEKVTNEYGAIEYPQDYISVKDSYIDFELSNYYIEIENVSKKDVFVMIHCRLLDAQGNEIEKGMDAEWIAPNQFTIANIMFSYTEKNLKKAEQIGITYEVMKPNFQIADFSDLSVKIKEGYDESVIKVTNDGKKKLDFVNMYVFIVDSDNNVLYYGVKELGEDYEIKPGETITEKIPHNGSTTTTTKVFFKQTTTE